MVETEVACGHTNEWPRILDPFAGIGRIHRLDGVGWVVGVELQHEWARQSHGMVVGNSERLPFRDGVFDVVCTSPTYGNRMADHHNAMEKCRKCRGLGFMEAYSHDPWVTAMKECDKCDGKGQREYKRHTYRHYHGSPLHPRNAGQMQWGPEYRKLHFRVWKECERVLRTDGLMLVNVSDHVRTVKKVQQVVPVVEFHRTLLRALGFRIIGEETIPTKRNRHGANYKLRVDGEQILIARREVVCNEQGSRDRG